MTYDAVASVGCRIGNLGGARFLSPFPAWIDSKSFDPAFRRAVRRFYPEERGGDDVMWQGWASAKVLARMLRRPGRNLTRQRFTYFVERSDIRTGITPRLRFTPDNHFPARASHLSVARCSDKRWHTVRSFLTDF